MELQHHVRILSGVQPTGTLHLGNYFGMMRPCIEMQEKGETYLFIADYHALTQNPDPKLLNQRILEVAIDFLACGLDTNKTIFFRQTDVPEVTELTWILSCLTPIGLLERCHSYKDKIAQGMSPNNGLFTYPVLMASDILIYKSNVVPVGKDQKQHLEVTRDIAQRFNNQYGEILILPKAIIQEEVAVVPGVDGQKMSKSYDNTIEIFGAEKQIRKKFMKIVTDSTPMEESKNPDSCNVFALYKLFANESEIINLRERYLAGGMGYGHAKQELFELYWEYFRPMRDKRADLLKNPDTVREILNQGATVARNTASATMTEIKNSIGIR